jgi:hypothetical protein
VAKDEAQALNWFQRAADQGDKCAQFELGQMYENGEGVPKDINQAITLYKKADDQGLPDASDALKRLGQ